MHRLNIILSGTVLFIWCCIQCVLSSTSCVVAMQQSTDDKVDAVFNWHSYRISNMQCLDYNWPMIRPWYPMRFPFIRCIIRSDVGNGNPKGEAGFFGLSLIRYGTPYEHSCQPKRSHSPSCVTYWSWNIRWSWQSQRWVKKCRRQRMWCLIRTISATCIYCSAMCFSVVFNNEIHRTKLLCTPCIWYFGMSVRVLDGTADTLIDRTTCIHHCCTIFPLHLISALQQHHYITSHT